MATVLEEFLVRLGFAVDLAQHRRFEDNLKSSNTLIDKFSRGLTDSLAKFADLATAATGSANTIAAAMGKISQAMAGTSYAADRIGVSIGSLRAMDTAVRSVGGAAGEAQSMMERLAQHMAQQPGFLLRFGIDPNTRPDQALLQLGDYFRRQLAQGDVGRAVATQQAAAAGLSYQEMLRLADQRMRPTFEQALRQRAGMGIDDRQISEQAERFNRLLAQVQERFQAFDDWLYTTWGRQFNDAMQNALGWFDTNLPRIQSDIVGAEQVINGFISAIRDFWNALSPGAQANIETIGVIAVLARLSSFSLLRIPSQIIAVATAIGYLVAGYQRWKETGRSEGLIDWSKWGPAIDTASAAIKTFNEDILKPLFDRLGVSDALIPAFEGLAAYLAGGAFLRAILGGGLGSLLRVLAGLGVRLPAAVLGALGATGGAVVGGAAVLGGVAAGNAMGQQRLEQAAAAAGFQQRGGSWWNPFDKMPTFYNPTTGETLDYGQMQQRLGMQDPSQMEGGTWWNRNMPTWLGGGKIDPGRQHTADEIATYMMAKGWSRQQAYGIAANALAESGGRPRIRNPSGHVGLFQWDQNRQAMFRQQHGHDMLDPNVSEETLFREELDFADWELRNTEAAAGRQLSMATTPGQAGMVFESGFERSGIMGEGMRRGARAEQLAAAGAAPMAPGGPVAPAEAPAGGGGLGIVPSAEAAPAPAAGEPVGNLGLVRKPDGTLGTPGAGGLAAPMPPVPPAAPPPATINNTVGDTNHVSQNFAPTITVNGVQDPRRTAQLIDRNLNRQWTEYGVHAGSAFA